MMSRIRKIKGSALENVNGRVLIPGSAGIKNDVKLELMVYG